MPLELFATDHAGPFISAHRGHSSGAPENTIPALQAATELGAHLAEVDVRITRDGKLVLMHDHTLDRTTDGKGLVSQATLAELRELDAGHWFDRKFSGTSVPTLDEVLAWSKGRIGLLIEMKNFPERDPRFIPEIVAAVKRNKAESMVIIGSFDHAAVKDVHKLQLGLELAIITYCRMADWTHEAKAAGAAMVTMEPQFAVQSDIAEMHAASITVLSAMHSIEEGRDLLNMGVDVLEVDDVQLARDTLRQLGRS